MGRMNGPKRKKIYEFLVRRDGERCFIGGEPGVSDTLIIDHWDNNSANNSRKNLHLLCRSMNGIKNPRRAGQASQKLSSECVRVSEISSGNLVENIRTYSAEFVRNSGSEPTFRHWLFANIVRLGKLALTDVINAGAEISHCSQLSIQRYVAKISSKVGLYRVVGEGSQKYLELRPEWARFDRAYPRAATERDAEIWKEELIEAVNKSITVSSSGQPNLAEPASDL